MIPRMVGSVLILLIALNVLAQEIKPLGSFDNVHSTDGGDHCYGYSLQLWQCRGQLLGLLDIHEGLCGDPPCGVLRYVSHDVKTGHLIFWAQIGERWDFEGTLKHDSIVGTLNGRRIHLVQNQNWVGSDVNSSKTLAGWCDFWSTVPRCRGVRELCETLKTQK